MRSACGLLVVVVIVVALACTYLCRYQAAVEPRSFAGCANVLFVLSDPAEDSTNATLLEYLHSSAASSTPQILTTVIEPQRGSDSKAVPVERQIELAIPMMENGVYSAVVAIGNQAANQVLKLASRIHQRIPVIFTAEVSETLNNKQLLPNSTSLLLPLSIKATADLGIHVFPKVKEVIVLTDANTSIERQKFIIGQLEPTDGVTYTYKSATNESVADILDYIKAHSDSLVVVAPWQLLHDSQFDYANSLAAELRSRSNYPPLVLTDRALGTGVLGGYFVPSDQLTQEITSLLGTVLYKGRAADVPNRSLSASPVLDYAVIHNNHISPSDLPAAAIIKNRPIRFFQAEPVKTALVGLGIAFLLTFLVQYQFYYLVNKKLKRSNFVIDSLPLAMAAITNDERILWSKNLQNYESADHDTPKELKDLSCFDYGTMSTIVHSAVVQRSFQSDGYEHDSKSYTYWLLPLPISAFNVPTSLLLIHQLLDYPGMTTPVSVANEVVLMALRDLPISFCVKSVDTDRYVYATALYANQADISPEQLVGKKNSDLSGRVFSDSIEKFDQQLIDSGKTADTQICETFWRESMLNIRVDKLLVNYRGSRFIASVLTDITENLSTTKLLHDNERLSAAVLDASSIMVFVKSPDEGFRYVMCNKAFADFLNRKKEDVVGKTDLELFSQPDDAERFITDDRDIVQQNKAREFLESAVDANGELRHIHTTKFLFTGSTGKRLLIGVATDVTHINALSINNNVLSALLNKVSAKASRLENYTTTTDALTSIPDFNELALVIYHSQTKEYSQEYYSSRAGLDSTLVWNSLLQAKANQLLPTDCHNKVVCFTDLQGGDEQNSWKLNSKTIAATSISLDDNDTIVLFVGFANQRTLSAMDIDCISVVASTVALITTKYRQAQVLSQLQAKFSMLVSERLTATWLHDESGNCLYANTAAKAWHPYTVDSVLSLPPCNVWCCGNSHAPANCPLASAIRTKQPSARPLENDGAGYYELVEPICNQANQLQGLVRTIVDVSKLDSQLRNSQAISNCLSQAITIASSSSPDTALRESILKSLCTINGAFGCQVFHVATGHTAAAVTFELDFEYAHNLPASAEPSELRQITLPQQLANRILQHDNLVVANTDTWVMNLTEKEGARLLFSSKASSFVACRLHDHKQVYGYWILNYAETRSEFEFEALALIRESTQVVEKLIMAQSAKDKTLKAIQAAQNQDTYSSNFLALMSHNINTPLNVIIGFAAELRAGNVDLETISRNLKLIEQSGRDLSRLLNDLLQIAHQGTLMPKTAMTPGALESCVRDIITTLKSDADKRHVGFTSDLSYLPTMMIDKSRLRLILLNVFGAAINITDAGVVSIKAVTSKHDAELCTLVLTIATPSLGLSRISQAMIAPTSQVPAKNLNAKDDKAGVNLSIAKKLLEAMDGKLDLEIKPGQCTNFVITLPELKYTDTQ